MNRTTSYRMIALVAAAVLGGCAYVQETTEGQTIRVVSAAEVKQCTHLGKVNVSVVKMARGEQYVRDDLIRLARNSAAKSGADTIVPAAEPTNGEQAFDMYRCIKQ